MSNNQIWVIRIDTSLTADHFLMLWTSKTLSSNYVKTYNEILLITNILPYDPLEITIPG